MSNGEARWWNRIVKDLMPNGWQDRGKDYALEVVLTSGLLTRKWQFGRHEITPSGVFHLWDHFWLIGHLSMQFEGLKRSRYLYGCIAEIRGKFSISYSDALGWKIRWRYFHVNCFGKSTIRLESESSPSQCGWQLYQGEPVDCLEEVPSAPPALKVLARVISKVVILKHLHWRGGSWRWWRMHCEVCRRSDYWSPSWVLSWVQLNLFAVLAKSHLEHCLVDGVGEVGARLDLSHREAILFFLRDVLIVLK